MKHFNHVIVAFCLMIGLAGGAQAYELKILVVVSQDVEAIYDGNSFFALVEDTVGDAFVSAGLVRPNIVLSAIRPQLGEQYISGSTLLALAYVDPISTQRTAQSADLVLMVVLKTNDASGKCGAAPNVQLHTPNYLQDVASGQFAINQTTRHMAYITMLHPGCVFLSSEFSAAHEIGHLLFAEHEVMYDVNGNASGEVRSNGDPDLPFKENHPKYSPPYRTIMYSQGPSSFSVFYSETGKEFQVGNPAYGPYEDVASVFQETTYDYVSLYKEPQPPNCKLRVEFNSCIGTTASRAITATLAGYTITNADYDWGFNGSTWFDLFNGALTCPSLTMNNSFWGRATLTLSTGQFSKCTIHVGPTSCDDDSNPF